MEGVTLEGESKVGTQESKAWLTSNQGSPLEGVGWGMRGKFCKSLVENEVSGLM